MMSDVSAAVYDITVTPMKQQYVLNDVITCSAKGFPEPSIQWIRRRESPGNPDDSSVLSRSNLTVTEDMIGATNSWTCTAENELNTDEPLSVTIEFTVIGMSVCLSVETT